MGSSSQRKRTLRRKNCSTKRFPPSTSEQVVCHGHSSGRHGLYVPCAHVEQHQARRSLVCSHTGDDDETGTECDDKECKFRTFERRFSVPLSLDALLVPRLWKHLRELVTFLLLVRRTGVRYRDCSFSTTSFPVQLHVPRQSPPAIFALVSAPSRASENVSTCPAWVMPTHPTATQQLQR